MPHFYYQRDRDVRPYMAELPSNPSNDKDAALRTRCPAHTAAPVSFVRHTHTLRNDSVKPDRPYGTLPFTALAESITLASRRQPHPAATRILLIDSFECVTADFAWR